ncbi:uncharacterized protein [Ptychodera flava]|uniref:uncharacterized protein n=1 Tax=Ptychodera flava TaxID=63121 RepID=UPI003969C7D5
MERVSLSCVILVVLFLEFLITPAKTSYECGGTLTDSDGKIKVENCNERKTCEYHIKASDGENIKIHNVDFEAGDGSCMEEYVAVYDGAGVWGTVMAHYCRGTTFEDPFLDMRSRSNSVYIVVRIAEPRSSSHETLTFEAEYIICDDNDTECQVTPVWMYVAIGVGVLAGVILVVTVIALIICRCCKKTKQQTRPSPATNDETGVQHISGNMKETGANGETTVVGAPPPYTPTAPPADPTYVYSYPSLYPDLHLTVAEQDMQRQNGPNGQPPNYEQVNDQNSVNSSGN